MSSVSSPKETVTIPLEWAPGQIYHFVGRKHTSGSKTRKEVYFGHFRKEAPPGLAPDQEYCLKLIHLNPSDCCHPQGREHFDLIDFKGDHIRQILAKNPAAEGVVQQLRSRGTYTGTPLCITVEPVYQSAAGYFTCCEKKPVAQRLNILKQYAQGCLELQGEENKIAGRSISAHRDIKSFNGMISMEKGAVRIRLIDFASIRLENDPISSIPHEPQEQEDTTAPSVLSPSNTAPEDVWCADDFQVGEKTDVYALGMMLGNLFLKIDGEYKNPGFIWAKDNGWKQNMTVDQLLLKMDDAFSRYREQDRGSDASKGSWIERALGQEQTGRHTLQWENTADPSVQREIRQLFFHATRIHPRNRISLGDFIHRLQELERKAAESRHRFPVSIYLFDRTNLRTYKNAYISAVSAVYTRDRDEAWTGGTMPPQIFPLSYAKAGKGQHLYSQIEKLDSRPRLQDSAADLSRYIRSLSDAPDSGEKDPLGLVIARACTLLMEQEDLCFTGKIHLFAPSVPGYDTIAKTALDANTAYDLQGLCTLLAQEMGVMPDIYIHAPGDCPPEREEMPWYTFRPLLPSDSADSGTSPGNGTDRSQEEPPFFTGSGAAYILTPQGDKLYIGRKTPCR
jgi:serine/threonine protein kinase